MSREYSDYDETDPGQRELVFPASRGRDEGGPRAPEPPRAEFFRAKRRPVLPLLGLVGAVATVATLLWLGRESVPPEGAVAPPEAEAPAPLAPAEGALAPVAAAPDFEVPFPEANPGAAPSPGSLAATPPVPAPAPSVPSVLDGPTPPGELATADPAPAEGSPAVVVAARPNAPPAARSRAGASRSSYAVQLLAARSEAQVGASWDKLRGTHPDLLASLTPSVGRTSGKQGDAFYRLRAGPLPDRASADALCKALSARQQACFVVPPGS